jgi:hypothetical protein
MPLGHELQALASLLVLTQLATPPDGSQLSSVHGLLSSQLTPVQLSIQPPPALLLLPSHWPVSGPEPALHDAPALPGTFAQMPVPVSHVSTVHGSLSSQSGSAEQASVVQTPL